MANTIQIKRSSTASDTPSASDLAVGELAVNTADAKLFTKHSDGTIKELAGGGGGGGMSHLVDDTSPQLGGVLDTNGNNIEFPDSSGIEVNRLKFGSPSDDLQIYHDTNHSYVRDTGTGALRLTGSGIQMWNSAVSEVMLKAIAAGAVELYHNNSKKLETASGGINVTGTVTDDGATHDGDVTFTGDSYNVVWDKSDDALEFADNAKVKFGDGNDLQIYHDGANSIIQDAGTGVILMRTNTLKVNNAGNSEKLLHAFDGGAVELYHNDIKKLETTADGVTLTSTDDGDADAPILTLFRDSASPADNDDLGRINFIGKNDAGQDVTYGAIFTEIADASDGTEDARVKFLNVVGGSQKTVLEVKFGNVSINGRLDITTGGDIRFEGTTSNDFETVLSPGDPTADRTITLPDTTGTVLTTGNSDTPTTTTSSSDADFVLVDDGGTMKKITPTNLGIGGGVTPATAYFDAFLNSDVSIGSGSATIAYDSIRQNVGSAFTLSSGEVFITVAGTYMVMYQVTIGQSGSSARTEGQADLQKRSAGTAFSTVNGTDSRFYSRSSNQDETTASMTAILTIAANDVVRVVAGKVSGNGLLIARAGRSRITIFRIA